MTDRRIYIVRDLAIIAALAAAILAWCHIEQYRALGRPGATLDDTYIHLRFCWNLAHGGGFAFNPGQPMPGSTSPLWVLLLTPFAFFSKQFLIDSAIIMSSLTHVAAAMAAYLLSRKIGLKKGFDLLAGLMAALNGRMVWAGMSGMETDLFACLTLAGFIVYLGELEKGRFTWRSAIIIGLASVARPEGYMVFAGLLLHYCLWLFAGREKRLAAGWRALPLSALAAYAAVIAPYMIFSLASIGHPLPSTYLAKHAEFGHFRDKYIRYSLLYFWLDNPAASVFFVGALFHAGYRAGKERLSYIASGDGLVAGWALGYLAVSAALTPMPFQFCRYQVPVLPFIFLFIVRSAQALSGTISSWPAGGRDGEPAGPAADTDPDPDQGTLPEVAGEGEGYEDAPDRRNGGGGEDIPDQLGSGQSDHASGAGKRWLFARLLPRALVVILIAPQFYSVTKWPRIARVSAGNIREMHVTIGKWLGQATGEDDVIATMDIGAIGYWSDREVLDLMGLVTPEIIPYIKEKGTTRARSESILEYLREKRPDYLAIFPAAFPGMIDDTRVFVPIYQVRLENNQIVAVDWMVVAKCFWDRDARTEEDP